MSGSIPLIDKEIIKLILEHLDNVEISRLLNKVPLKQGLLVLPDGASENARNKALQKLTLDKNLKYVIPLLESGQYSNFVKGNYENLKQGYSIEEFQLDLKKSHGELLDCLIYLIAENKLAGLINFFNNDIVVVREFKEFLIAEKINQIRFKRKIKANKAVQQPETEVLQKKINKLENENKNLKRKMEREIAKKIREFDTNFQNAAIEAEKKSAQKNNDFFSKLTQIKSELEKVKQKLSTKTKEYEELKEEFFGLQKLVKEKENSSKPVILVIGNLSATSILETQKYHILTLAKLSIQALENIVNHYDLFSIYIQTEYVSTGEYLLIKKRYPNIPINYTSKNEMEKN